MNTVDNKRARISTGGVALNPSTSRKLGLKGDCTCSSRNSAMGCWSKSMWDRKRTAGSCTAVPVLATAAATILLGADEKISALATTTTGSCTAGGTLATAVSAALRGAGAQTSGFTKRTAGSCTAVPVLATAAETILLSTDEKVSAVATATTAGACIAVRTLATAVTKALRGADAEASICGRNSDDRLMYSSGYARHSSTYSTASARNSDGRLMYSSGYARHSSNNSTARR